VKWIEVLDMTMESESWRRLFQMLEIMKIRGHGHVTSMQANNT
jgi:hypothetical protein